MSDIRKIIEKINRFRDERDWMQFHDPKNMAASITIEAAELLEHFQWKSKEEVKQYIKDNKEEVAEEIADVLIYLFELADNLGLDVKEIMDKKIDKNSKKYPVNKAIGIHTKYDKL
ncbi:MAG: nucleotide pyrophosphohydrolase [Patescibacteria group bacterium]|nr:nucleotide pyrophosphohydrolase [Patescibacteria group bacterium]